MSKLRATARLADRLPGFRRFGRGAPEEAASFVDGRYTLQVRQQVSPTEWSYQSVPETSTTQWLEEHAPEGARIGYDPWFHTRDWVKKAKEALATAARSWCRLIGIRSTRSGPTAPKPPRRTSSFSRTNMPANRQLRSGRRFGDWLE